MTVIDRRPLCILAPGAPLDAVSIRELGAIVYGLYLMFKYAAIGTKKLYTCIKGKITHIKH